MVVLSLFDGISCGQVALERAKIKVDKYYASEIDAHAISITQRNYPYTIQLGSVKQVDVNKLDKIDLLIGGSPCQGFSFAGKQLNFNDPRSALFFDYVRILNELRVTNPNIKFLLENVRMKREYRDIITQSLGVEPVYINSSLFGAAKRPRLYWANFNIPILPENNSEVLRDIMLPIVDRKYYTSFVRANGIIKSNYIDSKPLNRNNKCSCLLLSNNHKYSVNHIESYNIYSQKGFITQEELDQLDFRVLSPIEYERLQQLTDNYTSGVSDIHRYKQCGNGWHIGTIVHILKGLKDE